MPERISPVRDDSRTIFLERIVPKWAWPFTCRCRRSNPMVHDIARGIMVCQVCRLPGGFNMDNRRAKYMMECLGCGNDFICWIYRQHYTELTDRYCEDCGGTNVAKKGARTQDPMKFIEED